MNDCTKIESIINTRYCGSVSGILMILFSLICMLLLSSCNWESTKYESSSPVEREASSELENDTESTGVLDLEKHPYTPLTDYRFLDEYGPERVMILISDFSPLSDYPELLERLPFKYSYTGSDYPVSYSVAFVDWNGDGEEDYLVCAYSMGYDYTLFLSAGEDLLQIDAGGSEGNQVGLLDSETNGYPDIAFSSTYYHQPWRYDGNGQYRPSIPYIRTASLPSVSDRHNWYIEDGLLHIEYRYLSVVSPDFSHPYPYYMALSVDGLYDLLADPFLWCVEEGGYNLRGFNPDWDYAAPFTFVGRLHENADTDLIEQWYGDDPIWPSNIQIAVTDLEVGLDEQYSLLRATVPYPGQKPLWYGDQLPYTLNEPDETAQRITYFLAYIGDPQGEIRRQSDWDESYVLIRALKYAVRPVFTEQMDGVPDYLIAPQLSPIAQSVGQSDFVLREHVEKAVSELFDVHYVNHQGIPVEESGDVEWKWHELERVYTAQYVESPPELLPVVFSYEDTVNHYTVKVSYLDTSLFTDSGDDFKEEYERQRQLILAQGPRYEVTLTKYESGRLTFSSCRIIGE